MKKVLSISVIIFLFLNFSAKSNAEEVKDCFEGLNRATFAFNQSLDKAIIKPIAKGYRKLPMPVRTGASNVLSNISSYIFISDCTS